MKALEILISASAAFSMGYVWYGLLFTSHWSAQMEKGVSTNRSTALIYPALCAVAYFMNNGCLETHINGGDLTHGLFHGGFYGLSYAVPIIAIHHVYQQKRITEFLIDTAYALICFATIGGSLALLTLTEYGV